jgi:hypothetical protein
MLATSCFKRYLKNFIVTGLSIAILITIKPLYAEHPTQNEKKLQVVYIYNFLKFIRWPEDTFLSSHNSFEVCIVGKDPFGQLLDSWKTKKIDNKTLHINYFVSLDNVNKCHVAFIGHTKTNFFLSNSNNLKIKGLLTISANEDFALKGGIINFVMYKNKLRFNINRTIAIQNGLEINSKLLELAKSIY